MQWEYRVILALALDVASDPDDPFFARFDMMRDEAVVQFSQCPWHQHVQALPDHFGNFIPEHPRRGRIGAQHLALPVRDDHRIHRRLEDGVKNCTVFCGIAHLRSSFCPMRHMQA